MRGKKIWTKIYSVLLSNTNKMNMGYHPYPIRFLEDFPLIRHFVPPSLYAPSVYTSGVPLRFREGLDQFTYTLITYSLIPDS